MSKRIYRFHVYYGRSGDLDGLFIADDKDEATLRKLIAGGTIVYYGEVLGKHSDVACALQDKHLTPVDATEDEIATIQRVLQCTRTISGFCPLDYLACRDCGREPDECECPPEGA